MIDRSQIGFGNFFDRTDFGFPLPRLMPLIFLTALALVSIASSAVIDLKSNYDTLKVCANPDKGWYHHYYDNGTNNYLTHNDADLDTFPGMNHLYVRLSWAHFEPQEKEYDWHWIDDLKNHWVPKGYKISVRITSKETGETYATPKWVVDAGAQGTINEKMWCPYYGDPIFLQKLTAFQQAFAARYDGAPWLAYVDLGAIGTWGEGHEFPAGNQASVASVKKIIDIFADAFKKTLVVSADDMAGVSGWPTRPQADADALSQYSESKGFSWRDDSPMVKILIGGCPTGGVKNPQFFSDVYKTKPTVLEEEHYRIILSNGNWSVPDGRSKGADILECAIRTEHPTYIGYHGDAVTYLRDNPNWVRRAANLAGYWFFPRAVTVPDTLSANGISIWKVKWENHGVAPAYNRYQLSFKFGEEGIVIAKESDCRHWMPGEIFEETYSIPVPGSVQKGNQIISLRLQDMVSGRNVEIGLNDSLRDSDGFYRIAGVRAGAAGLNKNPNLGRTNANNKTGNKKWYSVEGKRWEGRILRSMIDSIDGSKKFRIYKSLP